VGSPGWTGCSLCDELDLIPDVRRVPIKKRLDECCLIKCVSWRRVTRAVWDHDRVVRGEHLRARRRERHYVLHPDGHSANGRVGHLARPRLTGRRDGDLFGARAADARRCGVVGHPLTGHVTRRAADLVSSPPGVRRVPFTVGDRTFARKQPASPGRQVARSPIEDRLDDQALVGPFDLSRYHAFTGPDTQSRLTLHFRWSSVVSLPEGSIEVR
jgi:hypothetical protein